MTFGQLAASPISIIHSTKHSFTDGVSVKEPHCTGPGDTNICNKKIIVFQPNWFRKQDEITERIFNIQLSEKKQKGHEFD